MPPPLTPSPRVVSLKAFEWLGHWYQGVGGDRERARGCFLRSVKLDPQMRGAGEALALLYLQNGQVCVRVLPIYQKTTPSRIASKRKRAVFAHLVFAR